MKTTNPLRAATKEDLTTFKLDTEGVLKDLRVVRRLCQGFIAIACIWGGLFAYSAHQRDKAFDEKWNALMACMEARYSGMTLSSEKQTQTTELPLNRSCER